MQWKWASSRVEAGISGFLSISDLDHRVSLELDRSVRPRLLLRNGTPLASRVVHWVTTHLLSCIGNLRVFPDDATGVLVPLRVVTSSTGLHSKSCPGIGFLSRVDREIGVFWNVAGTMRLPLEFFCETSLLLSCDGKVGMPFQKN